MQNRLAITERDGRKIELLAANTETTPHSGFTLVELSVVIAAVALIGMTMLPALARTRPNTGISQCMDNARQLAIAVQMYTSDNHDLYPPNPDTGTTTPGYDWCTGNVQGGMPGGPPFGPDTFDPDLLTNRSFSLIAPFINSTPSIFSCPADPRIGTYQGTSTNLLGQKVHAARSISMNGGVGTIDPGELNGGGDIPSGPPDLPVPGTWLTGSHGQNQHDNPWATFGKTADFRVVKPSQIFLTTDEDPYSINDSFFAVSAGTAKFVDYPATYHDHGCTMSFCDGHVELHRWEGSLIVLNGPFFQGSVPSSGPDFDDWTWLWQHATVRMH
jgi:prepilin-type N-terminal cleavage/methylation domain-containing protein/prepilin-type processing-associated H-X9-DG protein